MSSGVEATHSGIEATRSGIEASRSGIEGLRRHLMAGLWVSLLLAVLGFLVIYPVLTLLLGALTDTNPAGGCFSHNHPSITNFLALLVNPNVPLALLTHLY